MSPTKTNGRQESTFPISDEPPSPAQMIRADPTHGTKALKPGKRVRCEYETIENAIIPIPVSEVKFRKCPDSNRGNILRDRIVPSRSSHARSHNLEIAWLVIVAEGWSRKTKNYIGLHMS